MMFSHKGMAASASALVISLMLSKSALAQEPSQSIEGRSGVGDIVVTATRRSERLQDIPLAVTAISAQQLERQQITDIRAIQQGAPNLSLASVPNDPTALIVSIRGITQTSATITQDPAVGIYLDGVYIARAAGGNLALEDLERVEVLRGPQGTLFGRNTIGGAISLVTKKPVDHLEGTIGVSWGSRDNASFRGMLNIPLFDGGALRLTGKHSEHGGYARSYITGEPLGAANTDVIRGQFAIDLGGGWDVLVSGDYTSLKNSGQWVTLVDIPQLTNGVPNAFLSYLSQIGVTDDDLHRYVDRYARSTGARSITGEPASINAYAWGTSFTVNGTLGDFASLKSITAYRESDRKGRGLDLDGTPYFLSAQAMNFIDANVTHQKQFSEELQIFGKAFGDRLDWIAGAYYFEEKAYDRSGSFNRFPLIPTVSITDAEGKNTSLSGFAQLAYALTDRFKLTAGARYTKDRRTFASRARTVHPVTGAVTPNVPTADIGDIVVVRLPDGTYQATPPRGRSSYWPWTVGLDFRAAPDTLVYAKASRGFRAGGYNLRGATLQGLDPFNPERATAYELGVKSDLLDRRLRINAAVYHTDYGDIQLSQVVPTGLPNPLVTSAIRNAGSARIRGGEVEVSAHMGPLRLNGSFGYTDAKFTRLAPGVTTATLASTFNAVPKYTASIGGDLPIRLGLGELNLHADYSYQSRRYFAYVPPGNPAATDPGYGILNAVVTLHVDNPDIEISIWGRNLADKRYLEGASDLVNHVVGYPGAPRTFGASVTRHFGR